MKVLQQKDSLQKRNGIISGIGNNMKQVIMKNLKFEDF